MGKSENERISKLETLIWTNVRIVLQRISFCRFSDKCRIYRQVEFRNLIPLLESRRAETVWKMINWFGSASWNLMFNRQNSSEIDRKITKKVASLFEKTIFRKNGSSNEIVYKYM